MTIQFWFNRPLLRRSAVLLLVLLVAPRMPALSLASAQAAGPIAYQGQLTVIGRGAGSPDDLAVGADDTIYFGDMAANRIMRLAANGKVEAVSPVIREPEGIVVLPDGSLIVVEQATNRFYHVDPASKTMSALYTFRNTTGRLGIDGLSRDPASGDLLVPDAPNGRILRLSMDTWKETLIASGFKRPTSVALAADGTLYVCDEYGYAIFRVSREGMVTKVADVPIPDDVILDAEGSLIVNSLQGAIWRINLATGDKTLLVGGLRSPHGIALDSHGDVIIADAVLNQIYRLVLPPSPSTMGG